MRISRKFVDLALNAGQTVSLPPDASGYLQRVLRLRIGDTLKLFNGRDGRDYIARLTLVSKKGIEARILEAGAPESAPRLKIHLAIGVSRGERMDFAIQKAVELGVSEISPLLADRNVVQLDEEKAAKKLAHWMGVLTSACEQSGRRFRPTINFPLALQSWLENNPPTTLLLDHRSEKTLVDVGQLEDSTLGLMAGPEGGWSTAERNLALDRGVIPVRLGSFVLRTETAPLAAIAAAQVLWGDFRP